MEYTQLMYVAHYGIVNEVAYGLHGLFATHTAKVNIGLEIETFLVQLVLGLAREERHLANLGLRSLGGLQPVQG